MSISSITPRKLWETQHGRCFHCDGIMSPWSEDSKNGIGWTREHFVPKKFIRQMKSGAPKFNVVLAHGNCNRQRGAKYPTKEEVQKFSRIYIELFEKFGV